METKIIIEGLKQLIRELAQEKYQVERNGMAKAALDFVNIIENQANCVQSSEATAILPLVSGSTLHPVGKLPEGSEEDVCHLCRYKHECSDEEGVYERCLSELKQGEYYR